MKRAVYIKKIVRSCRDIKRYMFPRSNIAKCSNKLPPPSQMNIVFYLLEHSRASITELAHALDISSSAATQLVDNLEKRELIRRVPNPNDKRSVHIQLTKKAERLHEDMEEACIEPFIELFEALTDGELETYLKLQTKIMTHIHEKD